MDDDGGAAVAEQRIRAVAEGYIFILQGHLGFASPVDGEVAHVTGVVAFGIFQPVFFRRRIEMRACGLEIRRIALGILMKVDAVLSRRQIVELKLEADGRPLLPKKDSADAFTLSVFYFDFGFGCAGDHKNQQGDNRGERGQGYLFHAGIINNFRGRVHRGYQIAVLDPRALEYTFPKLEIFSGKSVIMAVDAVEPVTEQAPADDFQALEEKIYRTIEMYKAARQAQAAAERDAQRVREQLDERDQQVVGLRRETVQLKKEREEIRGRVEKMLEQIESIAEERAS